MRRLVSMIFATVLLGSMISHSPCSRTVKLRVHLAQRRLVVGSLGRQRRRHLQEARPRCQCHLYRRHAEGADVALRGRAASRRRHGPRGGERKSARRRRFDDHGFSKYFCPTISSRRRRSRALRISREKSGLTIRRRPQQILPCAWG